MRSTNFSGILRYKRSANLDYNNPQEKKKKREENLLNSGLCCPGWPQIEIERIWKKRFEKTVEHESDDYTNWNWCSWYSHQRIGTRTGGHGNNGWRLSKLQYCWDGPEYWEVSWRLEETCLSLKLQWETIN